MLSCKDATKLLSESRESTLPVFKRIAVKIHISRCALCARFKEQLMFMADLIHLYGQGVEADLIPQAGILMPPEAKERVRKILSG